MRPGVLTVDNATGKAPSIWPGRARAAGEEAQVQVLADFGTPAVRAIPAALARRDRHI